MNDHDTTDSDVWEMEPSDLDGHTIEELSDYLDADRQPPDASIDQSPGCRMALDALERLRALAPSLLAADLAAQGPVDDRWVEGILSSIARDARAGRRIPLALRGDTIDAGITEGAVRGLIRGAERAVPGAMVGRVRMDGDLTDATASVSVAVDVSVVWGQPIVALTSRLRTEIAERLRAHTTLRIAAIDISVEDVHRVPARNGASS